MRGIHTYISKHGSMRAPGLRILVLGGMAILSLFRARDVDENGVVDKVSLFLVLR